MELRSGACGCRDGQCAPASKARLTDRQYPPIAASLLDEPTRAIWRRRLRRQAWLLARDGERSLSEIALATAARLGGDPGDLARLPFVRAIVERNVAMVLTEAALAQLFARLNDNEAEEDA